MTNEAQAVLQQLADAGELTPERVVAHAREEGSPLHALFDWNDESAAHAHRLHQARILIRSVRVEITVHNTVLSVPKYVHDPARDDSGGYVPTVSLVNDRALAARVVAQEMDRALRCLERANRVAAAVGMGDTVAALIERVASARDEAKAAEPAEEAA